VRALSCPTTSSLALAGTTTATTRGATTVVIVVIVVVIIIHAIQDLVGLGHCGTNGVEKQSIGINDWGHFLIVRAAGISIECHVVEIGDTLKVHEGRSGLRPLHRAPSRFGSHKKANQLPLVGCMGETLQDVGIGS